MKHFALLSLLAITAASLTGCSTITISSDYNSTADFKSARYFEWLPTPTNKTGDPRLDNNDIMHGNIRQAVERQLIAQGYHKAAPGTADILLGYHVIVDQKVSAQVINNYYPSSYGYGSAWGAGYRPRYWTAPPINQPQVVVSNYEQGTLLLDIVDAYSKKLAWRGTASARLSQRDSAQTNRNRINSAVKKMLAEFPPKPAN